MLSLDTILPLLANPERVQQVAQQGTPLLVHAAGRLMGLGEGEQAALKQGRVPWWLWAAGGIALGFYAGVHAYKRYPEHVPEFVKGKGDDD